MTRKAVAKAKKSMKKWCDPLLDELQLLQQQQQQLEGMATSQKAVNVRQLLDPLPTKGHRARMERYVPNAITIVNVICALDRSTSHFFRVGIQGRGRREEVEYLEDDDDEDVDSDEEDYGKAARKEKVSHCIVETKSSA